MGNYVRASRRNPLKITEINRVVGSEVSDLRNEVPPLISHALLL